jgi:hypothetical protein
MQDEPYNPKDDTDAISSDALKAEAGSAISRLRELRQSFTDDVHVDLEVPGYRGELVARYGPLPWDVIRSLAIRGERGRRNPDVGPTLAADGLANAVEGFFFRENDGLTPVTWQGDAVTAYGDALASVLGIEGTQTVRETVKAVFPDEFALVSHYGELMEWQAERDDGDEPVALAAKADDAVHPTSN